MDANTPATDLLRTLIRRFLAQPASMQQATDAFAGLTAASNMLQPFALERMERQIREEIMANNAAACPPRWWRQAPPRPLTWLDLCNADGYVRERCLRCLGPAPSAFFMSLAIRRLNDWVPEVRASARENLFRIASISEPSHVAGALGQLLATMNTWGRMQADESRVVGHLMAIEAIAGTLIRQIIQTTTGPQAAILVQAARTQALDHSLLDLATQAAQPAVRATAYRFLLEDRATWASGRAWVWTDLTWCKGRFEPVFARRQLTSNWPAQTVLKSALEDRSPHVRRVGGQFLAKHLDMPDAGACAARLAADRSSQVAVWGRHALTRLTEDPRSSAATTP